MSPYRDCAPRPEVAAKVDYAPCCQHGDCDDCSPSLLAFFSVLVGFFLIGASFAWAVLHWGSP